MAIKYVDPFTTPLKDDGGRCIATLLWGDLVHVLDSSGTSVKVQARGMTGWVDTTALSDRSLLEIYVIDVGQGDGVLLKTPEGKWHLIYGLVNVRTDGVHILCATMEEKGNDFDVKVFQAGVEA